MMPQISLMGFTSFNPSCKLCSVATRNIRSLLGSPVQADGSLFGREYALVYRARLLNKTSPVEVTLRDKLYNFAHLFTTAGN